MNLNQNQSDLAENHCAEYFPECCGSSSKPSYIQMMIENVNLTSSSFVNGENYHCQSNTISVMRNHVQYQMMVLLC